MNVTPATGTVDFDAIKTRQRAMWASGNYPATAALIVYMSERLCEEMDLAAGSNVLDVATGSGNAAIAAARRGATVIGIDYVQALLDQAKNRADAENVSVDWQLADAENLPFDTDSFDAVMSVVGVMFAPNQAKAASEMVRVCKPGGRIVVANWTPEGFVGALLKTVGTFVQPSPGLNPPVRWGTEEGLRQLLGDDCELSFTRHDQVFRFETAHDFAQSFIVNYGPTERAHASLDADGQSQFATVLSDLALKWNEATDGTIRISATYLVTDAIPR